MTRSAKTESSDGAVVPDEAFRSYSLPLWRRVATYLSVAVLDGLMVTLIVAYPSVLSVLLMGPPAVIFAAFSWRRLEKWRTAETAEGLVWRDPGFGYRRLLRWEDIETFGVVGRRVVVAVKRNGRREIVTGLVNGETMSWDGGETKDIVGELNGRLAYWASARVALDAAVEERS